ncbi:hypothetical protein CCB80_07560 [Armatimonadetes bacterium Uphvl-Ar1]|nr:hypothetical protein CCB80_07560 [Armatimonadetes bacterium Uphvl-Ar1]
MPNDHQKPKPKKAKIKDPNAEHFFQLLDAQSPTTSRAMFGGYGFYSEGGPMYALYAIDQVYFKVDDANRPHFESAGQGPFIWDGGEKPTAMSYFSIPSEDWQNPDKLIEWITLAQQAADRAAAKNPKKKPRKIP